MRTFYTQSSSRGITLVEVLVAVGIVSLASIFIGLTVFQFAESRKELLHETDKMYLAEEGYEIIRLLRDENWVNLSGLTLNTDYYLQLSDTTLAIGTVPEIINGRYTRLFKLLPVYRNATTQEIVSSGGVLDNDSFKVEVSVGDGNGTTTVEALLVNFSAL
ncbi:MAG: prepilin-type N-terminal cleavage/methylation domain-containing protein [Patescibacteria group bacterium]